jgi:glycosyltransferase involved in cell wall biosynthesis
MAENKTKRLVIWQSVVSIHQAAFVRALAANPGTEVWFAYEQDLPSFRKDMGWTLPQFEPAHLVDVRNPEQWKTLVSMNEAGACHVFGGYFHLPRAYAAFRRLRQSPCRRVWTTEAFNFQGWKGWIRLQRARWLVRTEAGAAFHRVFAMGNLGMECFRRAGIETKRLREFGYVVEQVTPPPRNAEVLRDNSDCQFLYVGQLIYRKGVDLLLQAIARLPQSGWSLTVIGDGSERKSLEVQAKSKGLSSRVRFLGNLDNITVLNAVQAADLLVLPSRWDGWGAVINESLMVGTPVIVSDASGSASLVVHEICGQVFRRCDIGQLSRALRLAVDRLQVSEQRRPILQKWARMACGAEQLASYFLSCVDGTERAQQKSPPWRAAFQF